MFLRNLQQKAATMHQQGVRSALNQKQNLMGTMQRRGYQYYGSKGYATGFERMILDKFNKQVANDPRVENVILPLRDGINVIRKL